MADVGQCMNEEIYIMSIATDELQHGTAANTNINVDVGEGNTTRVPLHYKECGNNLARVRK